MNSAPVITIALDPTDAKVEQGPFVRVSLTGGCGLPGCNCSPEPFLLMSDGVTILSVELTADQVESLRATGELVVR